MSTLILPVSWVASRMERLIVLRMFPESSKRSSEASVSCMAVVFLLSSRIEGTRRARPVVAVRPI